MENLNSETNKDVVVEKRKRGRPTIGKEKLSKQEYNQRFRNKIEHCDVCNKDFKRGYLDKHNQSEKHKHATNDLDKIRFIITIDDETQHVNHTKEEIKQLLEKYKKKVKLYQQIFDFIEKKE